MATSTARAHPQNLAGDVPRGGTFLVCASRIVHLRLDTQTCAETYAHTHTMHAHTHTHVHVHMQHVPNSHTDGHRSREKVEAKVYARTEMACIKERQKNQPLD